MGNKAKRGISRSTQRYGGLRRRWRGFIALEPTDRVLFLKLWGQLAIVSVLLRLLVMKHARWLLTCLIPEKPNYAIRPDQALSYAQRVGYLTRKASRHCPSGPLACASPCWFGGSSAAAVWG